MIYSPRALPQHNHHRAIHAQLRVARTHKTNVWCHAGETTRAIYAPRFEPLWYSPQIRPLAPGACVNLTFMIILPCRLKHCATQILYGLIEYMRRDKRHAQRGLHQLRLNLKNSSPIRIIRILCADANRIKWRPHTPLWFWKSSSGIIYQKMVALCCFSSANARILRNCKRINAKPNVPL